MDLSELPDERQQRAVLRGLEWLLLGALELNADGEVVAAVAAAPGGDPGVPRAALRRHELDHRAVAPDEKVSRHSQFADFPEIGMRLRVEAVGEQALDRVAAVLPRRQADRVQHD